MSSIIADPNHPNVVRVAATRNYQIAATGELGSAVTQLQEAIGLREKCSPMRLAPIPWGKRDRELGFKVLQNIVDTMPPIVVPWSIKATRIVQSIHAHGGIDLKVRDLRTLIPERFRPRSV